MRIRSYVKEDFPVVSQWLQNEEEHTLWCAGKFPYPLTEQDFHRGLEEMAKQTKDAPFVATTDDGIPVGFFSYSMNHETNEGMLRFVAVDPAGRGHGIGTQMIGLAVDYAFTQTGADAVTLNVFIQNAPAIRCYQKAGFAPRRIEENAVQFHGKGWHRYNMVKNR